MHMHRYATAFRSPLIALAAVLLLLPAWSSAQTTPTVVFQGNAFGTTAFVGSTVKVGRTAPVGTPGPCGTTKIGFSASGTVASVFHSPLVITGVNDTAVSNNSDSATASSVANHIQLLGSLITASEVKAVSTTSRSALGLTSSGSGSALLNLVVAGKVFSSTPAPNTVVTLNGVGKVVLNEQVHTSTGLVVNMIHVFVTVTNSLKIATGTQIIVSHASSGILVAESPAVMGGMAFGTRVNVGSTVKSSFTAPVWLGCQGTGGRVITRQSVGISVPGILSTGTITDTAKGTVSSTSASGEMTSTIQGVNLLNSLVQASVIKADSHAHVQVGQPFQFSVSGTGFLSLSVKGHPAITASVSPNTRISISGLGTLYLRRQIRSSNRLEIRMIELVINQSNSFGLPIGTDIKVGVAVISLHSNTTP